MQLQQVLVYLMILDSYSSNSYRSKVSSELERLVLVYLLLNSCSSSWCLLFSEEQLQASVFPLLIFC